MIDTKALIQAIDLIEQEKGISKDAIVIALKEAFEKAYRKQLGSIDDALVRADIDLKKGVIKLFQLKKVVENVEDDFLEISLEEVKALGLTFNIGDTYQIEASPEDFQKSAAMTVKAILRQKIAEAEKSALFEVYKDKIGEMIVGQVEKIDERSAIVNIGRTSVYLPSSKRIPGETFKVGDRIKLYVVDVESTTKGAQIAVSRIHEGFLKRLFEEELPEIYEGTVIIKDIAREAGLRSKVAVYSLDPNVDAAGACIGQNGSRIQKIVSQLGNAKDKEKIDIIAYTENLPLYLVESLKPAQVTGIIVDEVNKKATMVIADENLGTAIGRRGVNPRLATKLTGYQIEIKDLTAATAEGLKYLSVDQLRTQDDLRKQREALPNPTQGQRNNSTTNRVHDESFTMEDVMAPRHDDAVVEKVVGDKEETEVSLTPTKTTTSTKEIEPVLSTVSQVTTKPKAVQEPPKVTVVKTTKTLEELEKELEQQKARTPKPERFDKKKKPFKKKDRDDKPATPNIGAASEPVNPANFMKIYDDETPVAEETPIAEVEETESEIEDFDEYYEEEK
ncbi:MAG: transcription termination/antitermination protein NusA [Firmicutes bacterium]|nr:transcription termination/antitermination protein NusA [Bacillota bacterium]